MGDGKASQDSWGIHDQLKRPPQEKAHVSKPPTSDRQKPPSEERRTLGREASGRNLYRRPESDIREPLKYDDLVDLTMHTEFADAASVCVGVSGLPRRSRPQLSVTADRRGPRSAASLPTWVAPKKAKSTNRGLHTERTPDDDRSAKSSSADVGDFLRI